LMSYSNLLIRGNIEKIIMESFKWKMQ